MIKSLIASMVRTNRFDILALIASVVSYFLSFAAAFATGDWHWLAVGPVIGVSFVCALISSRLERLISPTARCPRFGGRGRVEKEDRG